MVIDTEQLKTVIEKLRAAAVRDILRPGTTEQITNELRGEIAAYQKLSRALALENPADG